MIGKSMAVTPTPSPDTMFPMKSDGASAYNSAFTARVRDLRERRGWSQQQMARALQIPWERYRKYAQNIMMPHRLIPLFVLVTDTTMEYLLGEPPSEQP